MYHTIDYIVSKPTDFQECKECNAINWYENEECHICHGTEFKELTEKDLEGLTECFHLHEEIQTA